MSIIEKIKKWFKKEDEFPLDQLRNGKGIKPFCEITSFSWLGKRVNFQMFNPDGHLIQGKGVVIGEYLELKKDVRPKIYYTIIKEDGDKVSMYEDNIPSIVRSKLNDNTSFHTAKEGAVSQKLVSEIGEKATKAVQGKIREYCDSWCVQECVSSSECPLKVYKK